MGAQLTLDVIQALHVDMRSKTIIGVAGGFLYTIVSCTIKSAERQSAGHTLIALPFASIKQYSPQVP